jgi:hypothetical protein
MSRLMGMHGWNTWIPVEELTDYINSYLRDPELDGIGRRKIREEQCWKLDGKSGERIANYILKYLDE